MKIVAVSGMDQQTSTRLAVLSWGSILALTALIFWATMRKPRRR